MTITLKQIEEAYLSARERFGRLDEHVWVCSYQTYIAILDLHPFKDPERLGREQELHGMRVWRICGYPHDRLDIVPVSTANEFKEWVDLWHAERSKS